MDDSEVAENMKLDLLDMDICLNNVVSNFSLGPDTNLDLENLVLLATNIEIRGGKGYAQMKLKNPASTANIFASGRIVVCGTKSEEDAKIASRKIARKIQKVAIQNVGKICTKPRGHERICVKNYKIVNVWASTVLPWDVKLTNFAKEDKKAQYEPEIHSSVIYQLADPKANCKINAKGSLVIQANKIGNIYASVRKIYPIVYPFQKPRRVKKAKKVIDEALITRGVDKMWRSNKKI